MFLQYRLHFDSSPQTGSSFFFILRFSLIHLFMFNISFHVTSHNLTSIHVTDRQTTSNLIFRYLPKNAIKSEFLASLYDVFDHLLPLHYVLSFVRLCMIHHPVHLKSFLNIFIHLYSSCSLYSLCSNN